MYQSGRRLFVTKVLGRTESLIERRVFANDVAVSDTSDSPFFKLISILVKSQLYRHQTFDSLLHNFILSNTVLSRSPNDAEHDRP